MPIMVDYTTSLETACKTATTSFLHRLLNLYKCGQIYIAPAKKLPSETSNNARDSNTPLSTHNIFVDESNAQQSQSESQARRTPRPPNAFILYRKAKQPDVIKNGDTHRTPNYPRYQPRCGETNQKKLNMNADRKEWNIRSGILAMYIVPKNQVMFQKRRKINAAMISLHLPPTSNGR